MSGNRVLCFSLKALQKSRQIDKLHLYAITVFFISTVVAYETGVEPICLWCCDDPGRSTSAEGAGYVSHKRSLQQAQAVGYSCATDLAGEGEARGLEHASALCQQKLDEGLK